jgi:hypothetical protein
MFVLLKNTFMKYFTGKSSNGDIQEALADAIRNAKESLKTDFITWKLETVQGKNGGFIERNDIEVTVGAQPAS